MIFLKFDLSTTETHLQLLRASEKDEKDRLVELMNSVAPVQPERLEPLLSSLERRELRAGEQLFQILEKNENEYFVTQGVLRTHVISDEGDDVTFGFYDAPSILCPSITRTHGGVSTVFCEALEDSIVYGFEFAVLGELMVHDAQIQNWGNTVLRNDLLRRAHREQTLVTKNGAQRLQDFRNQHGDLESRVQHSCIASYLGMTTVSLSRLRNAQ